MNKIEYFLSIRINRKILNRVLVDQYYRKKHPDIDDKIILELIKKLNPDDDYIVAKETDQFQYFRIEPVFYNKKPYRLVLVIDKHDDYLGIINAFRIRKRHE